jgi:ketosteroid isomerase-like protein
MLISAYIKVGHTQSVAEANADTVRRFFARVNAGDLAAALADVAEAATLDWSGSEAPDRGVYTGPEGWGRWFSGRSEGLPDVRFEATEITEVPPDKVLVAAYLKASGRTSGAQTAALGASVWTFNDGRITSLTLHQTRDGAARALGLEV